MTGVSVTLVAGQRYTITLYGGTLFASYFRAHDSGDSQIEFDDDGGTCYNSELTFTAAPPSGRELSRIDQLSHGWLLGGF